MGSILKSFSAVLQGLLLAFLIGALVIFGIAAPFFTFFLGLGATSTALPSVVVVLAAAFAFYWGGYRASYKAPSRRRLHGVLVGVLALAVSLILNFGTNPFTELFSTGALLLTVALCVAVVGASYVGALRGEALHAENLRHHRARERARSREGSEEGFPEKSR